MNDFKNILLAWASASSVFAAVEAKSMVTIVSAIILPIVFFTVGKTIDVLLQIYLRRSERTRLNREKEQ